MNTMNPNVSTTITMTRSSNGIAFGMHASGAYAPSVMELPCSFAGSVNGPTQARDADVAFEHDQGTLVWSPPT